jgi:phosphoribosylanthranilate isomerase
MTATSPQIKMCGMKRLEDARFAAASGADFLGFIRHAASPRYVDTAYAKELLAWIYGPQKVGVYVGGDARSINEDAQEIGFDYVQIHGDLSQGRLSDIAVPVVRALSVGQDAVKAQLLLEMDRVRNDVSFFLVDAHVPGQWGGTGQLANWDLARTLAASFPIMLAGGLTPDNVAAAIEHVKPWGVDVASGIETAPAEKDFALMESFFESVRPFSPLDA